MTHAARYLAEVRSIADRIDPADVEQFAHALAAVRTAGGRLFFVGVGGSASNASHATCDFRKIGGFEAYCVTDNVAELTARTNDEGWESAFSEYLQGSGLQARDALFVLSVGGGDPDRGVSGNLVRAMVLAQRVGAQIFAIVGRDGGYAVGAAHQCLVVPTVNTEAVTAHTEAFQGVLCHLLVTHPLIQRRAMKWEELQLEAAP